MLSLLFELFCEFLFLQEDSCQLLINKEYNPFRSHFSFISFGESYFITFAKILPKYKADQHNHCVKYKLCMTTLSIHIPMYLLCTYYMPGNILEVGNTRININKKS